MNILAIDPGTNESAMVIIRDGKISDYSIQPNSDMLKSIRAYGYTSTDCAIEMIASYGMPVGKETFETCLWIGRFIGAWEGIHGKEPALLYRKDIKMHLCGTMKAKDGNIRQALLDKWGPQGTKKSPGPTYGISSHVWAALAVATTFMDKHVA